MPRGTEGRAATARAAAPQSATAAAVPIQGRTGGSTGCHCSSTTPAAKASNISGRTEGRAILREGVRPDVAVIQQFGHWATPFARGLAMPNLNQVATMDLALTDATGSGADWVPVAIRPSARRAAAAACARGAAWTWTLPWSAGLRDLRERCAIDEAYVRGL